MAGQKPLELSIRKIIVFIHYFASAINIFKKLLKKDYLVAEK
jgi:hypothetical protein